MNVKNTCAENTCTVYHDLKVLDFLLWHRETPCGRRYTLSDLARSRSKQFQSSFCVLLATTCIPSWILEHAQYAGWSNRFLWVAESLLFSSSSYHPITSQQTGGAGSYRASKGDTSHSLRFGSSPCLGTMKTAIIGADKTRNVASRGNSTGWDVAYRVLFPRLHCLPSNTSIPAGPSPLFLSPSKPGLEGDRMQISWLKTFLRLLVFTSFVLLTFSLCSNMAAV